jgi:unsaturated rhamnogalacturonyl hydrolase
MKTLNILLVIVLTSCMLNAQTVFEKSSIKSIMDKVNKYRYENPWAPTDSNWVRGAYYTGVMAGYQATGDEKYLQQCENLGEMYHWGVAHEDPDSWFSGANLLTITQTWLECYMIKQKKEMINPVLEYLEKPNEKNPVSVPSTWYHEGGQRYVDALYVAPPALAMLYKITGNEKYANWMDSFYWDVYGELYDEDACLFYRDDRFLPHQENIIISDQTKEHPFQYQRTLNGKKVLWSRGNGWAFAGTARILKYLPKDYGNRKKYEEVFIDMARSLKERQKEDGSWGMNLDDPKDFPYKESSGTGFFIYGMAWGINNGILNEAEYRPVVEKGWKALCAFVSDEGKVQWGQHIGFSPCVIKQEDSHEYISGIFLLAGSEVYKMNFK